MLVTFALQRRSCVRRVRLGNWNYLRLLTLMWPTAVHGQTPTCYLAPQQSSPPTNGPDGQRIFPSQLDFWHFMADHKAFALTQPVPPAIAAYVNRFCHQI